MDDGAVVAGRLRVADLLLEAAVKPGNTTKIYDFPPSSIQHHLFHVLLVEVKGVYQTRG